MRSVLPAIAVFLVLLSIAANLAVGSSGPPASPPANVTASPASAPAAEGDAAAKHAKRTACIKTAKEKKLVGAQKTAFIKECMAVP
jgi:predicted small lipoprotein YifL